MSASGQRVQECQSRLIDARPFALARTCDIESGNSIYAKPFPCTANVIRSLFQLDYEVRFIEALGELQCSQRTIAQLSHIQDQRAIAIDNILSRALAIPC